MRPCSQSLRSDQTACDNVASELRSRSGSLPTGPTPLPVRPPRLPLVSASFATPRHKFTLARHPSQSRATPTPAHSGTRADPSGIVDGHSGTPFRAFRHD
jgi:hypothetical protein